MLFVIACPYLARMRVACQTSSSSVLMCMPCALCPCPVSVPPPHTHMRLPLPCLCIPLSSCIAGHAHCLACVPGLVLHLHARIYCGIALPSLYLLFCVPFASISVTLSLHCPVIELPRSLALPILACHVIAVFARWRIVSCPALVAALDYIPGLPLPLLEHAAMPVLPALSCPLCRVRFHVAQPCPCM